MARLMVMPTEHSTESTLGCCLAADLAHLRLPVKEQPKGPWRGFSRVQYWALEMGWLREDY